MVSFLRKSVFTVLTNGKKRCILYSSDEVQSAPGRC
nr:MAG TPA: hypothetical protein [Caudoviricetes sp.]